MAREHIRIYTMCVRRDGPHERPIATLYVALDQLQRKIVDHLYVEHHEGCDGVRHGG